MKAFKSRVVFCNRKCVYLSGDDFLISLLGMKFSMFQYCILPGLILHFVKSLLHSRKNTADIAFRKQ